MINRILTLYRTNRSEFWQFARFVIVGVLNTIVGYGGYLLFLTFQFHYLIAMVSSHIIGVIHSYFWNKYWTFKKKEKSHKEKVKFASVYAVTFAVNAGLLVLFIEYLGMTAQIAGLLAMFIVTIISFTGHKFWSFK